MNFDEVLEQGFPTEPVKFEDSGVGKQLNELQKLRQDFDQYRAEQNAKNKAYEERQRIERKQNLIISLAAGSFTGIASGIFLYYWPTITAWFFSSFH